VATYSRAKNQPIVNIDSVAELAEYYPLDERLINLCGYYSRTDGGGQLLVYDASSSATVDGGTVFNCPTAGGRYLSVNPHLLTAKHFGATTSSDTTEITAATTHLNSVPYVAPVAVYAEFYTHTLHTITIASSSTWYQITNGSYSVGESSGFTYEDGNDAVIALRDGHYFVAWQVSFEGGNNGEYHIGVSVNDETPAGKTHAHTVSNGKFQSMSNVSQHVLQQGDTLEMQIEDTANPSQDVDVRHLAFSVVEIR